MVAAIGVANGWIANDWLVAIAIATSISFMVATPLNRLDDKVYNSYRFFWQKFQRKTRLRDDQLLNTLDATIAIFGMGRVGCGAYDRLCELQSESVVGIDFNSELVQKHRATGRNVMHGDPSDADFWDNVERDHNIKLVMLALPNLRANMDALEQLREISFTGQIAATAKYPDDEELLRQSGATAVFNIYTEAGTGFADHVQARVQPS
ncbi:MAG: glutathione-regulated potassium-efflux system ancillary protein KefC [Myxococcota bacterium]